MAVATYARGGQVGLLVLTASHSRKQSLAEVKTLVQTASGKARKGRAWVDAQAEYGILGVVVGQEVTYSRVNGWHYHQHLSVPVDGPTEAEKALADGDLVALQEIVRKRAYRAVQWLAKAYKASIRAAGGKVSNEHGCKFRVADDWEDASDYTAKGSLAWEIAGAHKTQTKSEKGMTPWDIAEAAAAGDTFMRHRWSEYVEVMPGTRSCVVSAALAKVLEIKPGAPEKPDEDQEQQLHEQDSVVGRVDTPIWSKWIRHGLGATFLSRIEVGGAEGFQAAVDATERDAGPLEAARRAREATPEYQAQLVVWMAEADAKAQARRRAREARRAADPKWIKRREREAAEREVRMAAELDIHRRAMEYAPTADYIAAVARSHAVARSSGRAVIRVLDMERQQASRFGKTFVAPDVGEVMRLLAA